MHEHFLESTRSFKCILCPLSAKGGHGCKRLKVKCSSDRQYGVQTLQTTKTGMPTLPRFTPHSLLILSSTSHLVCRICLNTCQSMSVLVAYISRLLPPLETSFITPAIITPMKLISDNHRVMPKRNIASMKLNTDSHRVVTQRMIPAMACKHRHPRPRTRLHPRECKPRKCENAMGLWNKADIELATPIRSHATSTNS